MGISLIPADLRKKYTFLEKDHCLAILATDFPNEFKDLIDCLRMFRLRRSHILTPGGGLSPIPVAIDGFLSKRGWAEKSFDIKIEVDGTPRANASHSTRIIGGSLIMSRGQPYDPLGTTHPFSFMEEKHGYHVLGYQETLSQAA